MTENNSGEPKSPYIGKIIGGCRIVKEIGRGGMGIVYEAYQQSPERKVALKILPPSPILDAETINRFRREWERVASLEHEGIVNIYFSGEEQGALYYAMEFVNGASLQGLINDVRSRMIVEGDETRVKRSDVGSTDDGEAKDEETAIGPATEILFSKVASVKGGDPKSVREIERTQEDFRNISECTMEAAEVLEHVHNMGIVHRDIKPSNIMFTRDGRVKLVDFGIAIEVDASHHTVTKQLIGSFPYMSPEQVASKSARLDKRTDIYSLGATLYELLTLRRPFSMTSDGESILYAIIFEDLQTPRVIDDRIPKDLETIVLKAMERNRERRYQSAGEMAADLGRFINGEPVWAKPPTLTQVFWRNIEKHKTSVAIVAAAFFIFLVTGGLYYGHANRAIADRDQQIRAKEGELKERRAELREINEKLGVPVLVKMLEGGDLEERKKAVGAMKRLGDRAAAPALIKALSDENADIRADAVDALGKIGDKLAVKPLIKMLFEDPTVSVREHAAFALGRLGDIEAIEPLKKALNDDHDGSIRRSAAFALGDLRDKSGIDLITKALTERDIFYRRWAVSMLGRLRAQSAVPALLEALEDEDEDVSRYAAISLALLNNATGLSTLQGIVKDNKEDFQSRFFAAELLAKFGDKSGADILVKGLKSDNMATRTSAAIALADLHELANAPLMIEALETEKEQNPNVTRARFHLCLIYKRLNREEKATAEFHDLKRIYERNIEKLPNDPQWYNGLAGLSAKMGIRLDEGVNLAKKAIKLSGGYAGYIDTLSGLYYRKGEYDKAIKEISKAIEAEPYNDYYRGRLAALKTAKLKK